MTKSALRKIYKEKRKQISFNEQEKWLDMILINFQQLQLPFINCVHTYLAIKDQNEIDTDKIIRYLKFINPALITVVPKINLDKVEMRHYIFNETVSLAPNLFGIVEPVNAENIDANEIDMVITPLLAFDKHGYRVGYGKGFYDKFFLTCRNDVIKIGLSFFEPEDIIEDINPFDIPLNYCITPHTIYNF